MKKTLIIFLFIISGQYILSQDDSSMSQEEWEFIRDRYAEDAIKMLARIDTINLQIDSLMKVKDYVEKFDCEAELYKLVGATKEQVSDFRVKFDLTEKKIADKQGSPDEAGISYFNEIRISKLRCLPEFSERFVSMNKNLESWQDNMQLITRNTGDSLYTVTDGDYLRTIAFEKYGDEKFWKMIWNANKNGVYNADALNESYKKKIQNPDIIYPGQILRIPKRP